MRWKRYLEYYSIYFLSVYFSMCVFNICIIATTAMLIDIVFFK